MMLCQFSIVLNSPHGEFSVSVSVVLKCQSLNASSVVGRSKGSVLQLKLRSTDKYRIYLNLDKYILLFGQIHFVIWTNTFSYLDKYIFTRCSIPLPRVSLAQKLATLSISQQHLVRNDAQYLSHHLWSVPIN